MVLSIEITWLPVGGTMMRNACGTMIRRIILGAVMPSAHTSRFSAAVCVPGRPLIIA